jgi:molybdopterin/thiamine biosynthesis adenylyltransferase
MDDNYKKLFERNYGIFTESEQEKIRKGNVLLIGTGGIGGVIATNLARMGLEQMTIYEYDTYSITNANRQICCFTDTMERNKAIVVKETIQKINPSAKITVHERRLHHEEMLDVMEAEKWDVIVPAADEWPLSIAMLDACVDKGIPAVMSYPVGAMGRTCSFMPGGPYASECFSMPYRAPYEKLKVFMEDADNRRILYYYRHIGGWTKEWFEDFCTGEKTHPQISTIVWLTGTLAAMEVIKIITGRWKPVAAPYYWYFTPDSCKIKKFTWARRMLSRLVARDWGKMIIPFIAARPNLVRFFTKLIS